MKHVFVIETTEKLSLTIAEAIQIEISRYLFKINLNHFIMYKSNTNSAIRGVYSLYAADQSKSPDDLGSTV